MALPNLPFPVADLGWDKFDEVREAAQLDRDECITVMKLVCGDPPPGFESRSGQLTAPTKVEKHSFSNGQFEKHPGLYI